MVAKKAKSKRTALSQKYKIQKKVREHNRKVRKEGAIGGGQKKRKDPGIPNLFPFKEKLLEQINQRKQTESVAQLAAQTKARVEQFEEIQAETTDIVEQSRKFYRDFRKVVEASDVILKVLDARDPLGTRSKQIEELIVAAGASKRLILVINKIDLVPKEAVQKWLKHLRNEFPTIAFKASTQMQRTNLSQKTQECVGADSILKLLKNYCRNKNIKTSISVGVVGFPNVGKSSLINSLKRARVCGTGSTPGLTKVTQEIHLDKQIKLIDSPGIVFARTKGLSPVEAAQVALRNCLKPEQIEDPILPVELILKKCTGGQLQQLYQIPEFRDTQEFLIHVARQRGRIRKGGIPDLNAAAMVVISDWNNGRIPYYSLPPVSALPTASHMSSNIVSQYAQEFNLDDLEVDSHVDSLRKKDDIPTRMISVDSSMGDVQIDENGQEKVRGYNFVQEEEEDMEMDQLESDQDEEEDMEMEEEMKQVRVQHIQPKKNKIERETDQVFSEREASLNPQLNQQRKRELKARKKRATKGSNKDMDQDASYDFGEFFGNGLA